MIMKPGTRIEIGFQHGTVDSMDPNKPGQILHLTLDNGAGWWRPDMTAIRRIDDKA